MPIDRNQSIRECHEAASGIALRIVPSVRLVAIVAVAALAGCGSKTSTSAPPPAPFTMEGNRVVIPASSPLRKKIAIAPVTDASVTQGVEAPAAVEADPARQYRILTPLTGRITALGVHVGDRVRAGQVLATVAAPDLSSAQADDARARAQLRVSATARDRAIALKSIGGGADKDVQQAQADFAAAQAEAARAADRLRQLGASARMRGGGLALTAPAAGIVTDLAAAPGAFWTDTAAPLMTVADISTVWVTANVTESNLASIRAGQPATISLTAYPGETVTGRVQSVSPLLDPDTRRAKVRIAISNANGKLKPGMFGSVSFIAPSGRMTVVPTTALLLKDDATTVYAEVRPWTFERHVVETGTEMGGRTVITKGIAVGQRVIAKGGVLLDD
ncbi:efflux RND transporter periplasmic adaptor subunit [Sphingobium sp.]|uniref:efflux RND transporter periplasmic adaptor subunit n=1 Tax=Sphingobium sp. TaxID=1912891 RepID=UPI0025EE9387|nr:efflux RND transporter periplasmic adaptor subunit [Sphingobium sp.]